MKVQPAGMQLSDIKVIASPLLAITCNVLARYTVQVSGNHPLDCVHEQSSACKCLN